MCMAGAKDTRTRRPTGPVMTKKQGIHDLENEKDTDNQGELYFDQLEINTLGTAGNTEGTQELVQLKFQSPQCTNQLIYKLDTGAEGNVVPLTTYKTMSPNCHVTQDGIPTNLHPSNMRITAYGGHTVTHYGTCKLQVTHKNKLVMSTFHVVKSNGSTIIGLPTCRALKLVTLNYAMNIGPTAERDTDATAAVPTYTTRPKGDETAKARILNEYGDVFDGIGCFEGEYHITLDSAVPPVEHSQRRVPVALSEPLKQELDTLIQQGIIAKVERPPDWVNSCVCVTKPNGKLRLCLDPKDLNKAIKRPHQTYLKISTIHLEISTIHWEISSNTSYLEISPIQLQIHCICNSIKVTKYALPVERIAVQ